MQAIDRYLLVFILLIIILFIVILLILILIVFLLIIIVNNFLAFLIKVVEDAEFAKSLEEVISVRGIASDFIVEEVKLVEFRQLFEYIEVCE